MRWQLPCKRKACWNWGPFTSFLDSPWNCPVPGKPFLSNTLWGLVPLPSLFAGLQDSHKWLILAFKEYVSKGLKIYVLNFTKCHYVFLLYLKTNKETKKLPLVLYSLEEDGKRRMNFISIWTLGKFSAGLSSQYQDYRFFQVMRWNSLLFPSIVSQTSVIVHCFELFFYKTHFPLSCLHKVYKYPIHGTWPALSGFTESMMFKLFNVHSNLERELKKYHTYMQ